MKEKLGFTNSRSLTILTGGTPVLRAMITVDKITTEALSLSKNLRIQLVDKLLASIEVDVDENTQASWLREAKRRRDEISCSLIQPISGEEGMARVKQFKIQNSEFKIGKVPENKELGGSA